MIKKFFEELLSIPAATLKKLLEMLDKDLSITLTRPMYGGVVIAEKVEFKFTDKESTVSKMEIVRLKPPTCL